MECLGSRFFSIQSSYFCFWSQLFYLSFYILKIFYNYELIQRIQINLQSRKITKMYHNKTLTISNQIGTKNTLSGHNNIINLSNSQAIKISIAGNNNRVMISNTSLSVTLLGSHNKIELLNSSLNINVTGNHNNIVCSSSHLNVANNSGTGNIFKDILDLSAVSASSIERDSISEISAVGRSNSELSSDRSEPNSRHQVPNQPLPIYQDSVEQQRLSEPQQIQNQQRQTCFSMNKILQMFGCISNNSRRRNQQRMNNIPAGQQNNSQNNCNNGARQVVVEPVPVQRQIRNKKSVEGLTDQQLDKLYSNLVDNDKAGQCLICLVDIEINDYQTYLACFHHFHTKCIKRWLKKSPCCPLCQTSQKQLL